MRRSFLLVHHSTVAIVVAVLIAGCGGTSPSPKVPDVAGTYTGTLTTVVPNIGYSEDSPVEMVVKQSGAEVDITAKLTAETLMWKGRIDRDGVYTGDSIPLDETVTSCGDLEIVEQSLAFAGQKATISVEVNIIGTGCGGGTIMLTAVLAASGTA